MHCLDLHQGPPARARWWGGRLLVGAAEVPRHPLEVAVVVAEDSRLDLEPAAPAV